MMTLKAAISTCKSIFLGALKDIIVKETLLFLFLDSIFAGL